MKPLFAVAILFMALTAHAQSAASNSTMESQIRQRLSSRPDQTYFYIRTEKPNEIRRGGLSYSGILVQLAKTDNPAQLINPSAPAEYGRGEDNLVRNPHTQRDGFKVFSISF